MKSIRGTNDLVGLEYKKYKKIEAMFAHQMSLYGFEGVQLPVLEHASIYETAGETADIAKEMFIVHSVHNSIETANTVLRPEGTASCIRALIATGRIDEKALKVWYAERMFRHNRPQSGRYREFTQLGCEILNQHSPYDDAELIQSLVLFCNQLHIDCRLHINAVGSKSSLENYMKHLYRFLQENKDCLSEMNRTRLEVNVMRVLDQLSPEEKNNLSNIPNIIDFLTKDEQERFKTVCNSLEALDIDFYLDPYLVRGLDYYRHTVFELMHNHQAIAGGGCYVFKKSKFQLNNDNEIEGLGWAIGLERIVSLAKVTLDDEISCVVYAQDQQYSLEVATKLRSLGISTLVMQYSVKDVFKRAAALNAKFIVLCTNEASTNRSISIKTHNGEVMLKFEDLSDYFSKVKH